MTPISNDTLETLKELQECQGSVAADQYKEDEQLVLYDLEKLGLIGLHWVLTNKGKQYLDSMKDQK
jgi:hypothetical protein